MVNEVRPRNMGMTRGDFLRTAGMGAAALGAATMGMSGASSAYYPARGLTKMESQTLKATKRRGSVLVGLGAPNDPQWPYEYLVSSGGDVVIGDGQMYAGLDLDMGRCLASAIFGDKSRVKFVQATTWGDRIPELESGKYDVSYNVMTRKIARDANWNTFQGPVYHYGTFEYIIRDGKTPQTAVWGYDTSVGKDVALAAGALNVREPSYDTVMELAQAYINGEIDAMGNSASVVNAFYALAEQMGFGEFTSHTVDALGYDPICAGVRNNDSVWQEIVSYVLYGLLQADSWGWENGNIEWVYSTQTNPNNTPLSDTQKRWLGLPTSGTGPEDNVDFTARWGIPQDWLLKVILQNGNYKQIYNRHLPPRPLDSPNKSVQSGGKLDTVHL